MEQVGAAVAMAVLAIAVVVVVAHVVPGFGPAGRRVSAAVVVIAVGVGLVLAGDVGGWEVESCGASASCGPRTDPVGPVDGPRDTGPHQVVLADGPP